MADKGFVFGNHSDCGSREDNQDYFGYFSTHVGELFLVCDGVGGSNGGKVASHLAVSAVQNFFKETDLTDPYRALAGSVAYANTAILSGRSQDPALSNMATTIVAFLLCPGPKPKAWVAHLGDSRLYRIRQGRIEQLTKDHTTVQEMVDHGILTPQEAENHPNSHVISRHVGMKEKDLRIEISELQVCRGDRYIACTDGITGPVADREILQLSQKNKSPAALSLALVGLANDRGGPDNSTIQVIDITKGPAVPGRAKRLAIRGGIAVAAILLVFGGINLVNRLNSRPVQPATPGITDAITLTSDSLQEFTLEPAEGTTLFRIDSIPEGSRQLAFAPIEGEVSLTLFEGADTTKATGTFTSDTTILLASGTEFLLMVRAEAEAEVETSFSLHLTGVASQAIEDVDFDRASTFALAANSPLEIRFPGIGERDHMVELVGDTTGFTLSLYNYDDPTEILSSGQGSLTWRGTSTVTSCLLKVQPGELSPDSVTVQVTLGEADTTSILETVDDSSGEEQRRREAARQEVLVAVERARVAADAARSAADRIPSAQTDTEAEELFAQVTAYVSDVKAAEAYAVQQADIAGGDAHTLAAPIGDAVKDADAALTAASTAMASRRGF